MLKIKEVKNKEAYSQAALAKIAFSPGGFLQSFEWGEFLKESGFKIKRFIFTDEHGKALGRATVQLKNISPFLHYGYCPFGPELDYKKLKSQELNEAFEKIKLALSEEGCSFFRFNLPIRERANIKIKGARLSQAKSIQPEKTAYLKTDREPEVILKQMKPKTRYNIRLSRRKGVVTEKDNSPKAIENFLRLTEETGKRNHFATHPSAYYRRFLSTLGKDGMVRLYTAFFEKKPLASNLVVFYKDTVTYLHGASLSESRNLMPTYLLQYSAIVDACREGFSYYDFWGFDEKKWPGVARFKQGFNGKVLSHKPTLELPIKRINYSFYRFLRKILNK